ncbi:MAG TPA: hypothetical protein VGC42_14020 [Kofleriaceae bacterium]
MLVALAIPGAALAGHFTSATPDCCADGSACCPGCPLCAHGQK